MKDISKNTELQESCITVVNGSFINFTICSYENLPDKNCRVFVCINGVPQKRTRDFIVNGDKKYIKKGKSTKKITHFKIK